MSYFRKVEIARNDLGYDAWDRPKTIQDYSILHGVWTFDIPDALWKTSRDDVEYILNSDNTYITSIDGYLNITSGITKDSYNTIVSKRHPRYQPNRGHLYSNSIIIDDIAIGIKEFGLFTSDNGIFFRQKLSKLYAVRKSLGAETEIEINIGNIDLTKGNVYDIQFQWRGVGSYKFYINLQLVYEMKTLGTLDALSIANPALPASYKAICTVDNEDCIFKSGCVDITSEGGKKEGQLYKSITTGENLISVNNDNTFGEAILAIRIPETYKGKYNTIDSELLRVTTFCKDESNTLVFITRDKSVIGNIDTNDDPLQGWTDVGAGIQYMIGGHSAKLETTFTDNKNANVYQVGFSRAEIDFKNTIDNPSQNASYYLTNGDYLIVCIDPDGDGKRAAATIELGVEI